mmetsp:Transcript_34003/g.49295  ORF Transcript_34003/g.49295 Transcript_34003/m.49295 type:complete len:186 (-) Transcript_34003:414-971(-)
MGISSKKASKLHKASARTSKLSTKPSRQTAAAAATVNSSKQQVNIISEPDVPKGQQLSKGQRKRQAKRLQYLRRERLIQSSLALRKKDIMAVTALKDAIGVVSASAKNDAASDNGGTHLSMKRVKSNRGKKRLQNEEVMHMSLVLQHPQFNEDPFGTLQEHLRNSVASNHERDDAAAKGNKKKHR